MSSRRRLSVVMFTDIAGYTALSQENESEALVLQRDQQELLRPLLARHHGREVKSTGDGFLVEFDSARDATLCAVEFQQGAHDRNAVEGTTPLRVRIGIHLGDVERRGSDILGDAVNVAARIESAADPGGVCLSAQVFEQVRGKVPFEIERLDPRSLKGIRDPVSVYKVVLPWSAPPAIDTASGIPRLAVLPLASISPDPKDEYFADGLTEELISVLSQIRGLRVISRTSVNQFRGTTKPVAEIGAALGVASILEGSVRRAGDQLRITVQLIDVETDEHRWAQTYDRRLDNVFAIQAEVAEQTAAALRLELLGSARAAIQRGPTSDIQAYDLYLRGLAAQRSLYEDFSPASEAETQKCFEGAIQKDPKFALAYAQLANSLIAIAGVTAPGHQNFPRARTLVDQALHWDPGLAEAHIARGNLACQSEGDWVRSEAEFRTGLELNPNMASAHGWYAILLAALQRFPEARDQLRIWESLDPLHEAGHRWTFLALHLSGDEEGELAHARSALQRYPKERWPHLSLGMVWANRGELAKARRELELARGVTGFLGLVRTAVLPRVGKADEARRVLRQWEEGLPGTYVPMTWVASLHAALGQNEAALDWLERDFREGDRSLWFDYQWDHFDALRDEPRFITMLRSANLPMGLGRPRRPAGP